MPVSAEATIAVRAASVAKWAWMCVIPSRRRCMARSTACATSEGSIRTSSGISSPIVAPKPGSSSCARANTSHSPASRCARGRWVTGACTCAICGWKRASVVGRSA